MRRINHSSRFIAWSREWKSHTTIRDLVDTSVDKASRKFKPEDIIRYIDISSVDGESNSVIGTTEYKFSEAPSRAQQCTRKGDILVSTVRPNLKNIAVNQLDEDNLVASSGFCVLRPKEEYSGLILAYVLSEPFTLKMVAEAKGSNYPAIHDSDILDYPITVPESHDLASVGVFVQQADKSKFSDFKSRFIAHFLGSSYTKKRLGDVCSVFSGKTVDLTKENEGGPIAYLKVADLSLPENDRVITTSSRFVSEQTAKASGLVPIGATIFPKNGAAALHNKKRITSVITCVDMNTMAVYSTSDTVMPEYLYGYLESQDLAALTLVGAIPQIRAKDVQSLTIPVPSVREQEQYVAIMHQADKSKYLN